MQGGKDREKGEGRSKKRQSKDTIVTITDGRTDGQAVWQVHRGTDRQTNRMCIAECAQGDYLTVCWKEQGGSVYMSVCISVFVDLCLLHLTVLFVCAHSCVPICAVQISHCWGKAL